MFSGLRFSEIKDDDFQAKDDEFQAKVDEPMYG
jgi:hypothetical protein